MNSLDKDFLSDLIKKECPNKKFTIEPFFGVYTGLFEIVYNPNIIYYCDIFLTHVDQTVTVNTYPLNDSSFGTYLKIDNVGLTEKYLFQDAISPATNLYLKGYVVQFYY